MSAFEETVEKTVVKAKEVIDITGKKANEVISVQKLRMNAASLKSQITRDYETIGKLTYEAMRSEDVCNDDAIAEIAADLDDKIAKRKEIMDEIARTKGGEACGECGAVNPAGAAFCNSCGKKL